MLFAFIFMSKHIMQTLHYDSNDKMNKKEYNFLYSLDRLSSGSTNNTIKKLLHTIKSFWNYLFPIRYQLENGLSVVGNQ